uniref:Ovule protein n=1 Tax=Meloidogyne incognita TaxID=6306 RepID=A0A914LAU4_MELIC
MYIIGVVFAQYREFLCNVGPKITATTTECIWPATILRFWVTPKNIKNLSPLKNLLFYCTVYTFIL